MDIKFEAITGQGPGGQHRNKKACTIRATHVPTGITVTAGSRSQVQNKKRAVELIQRRLNERQESERGKRRKQARLAKIRDKKYIRTYDYKKQRVKDHRTGKTASLDDVLTKGKLELLR